MYVCIYSELLVNYYKTNTFVTTTQVKKQNLARTRTLPICPISNIALPFPTNNHHSDNYGNHFLVLIYGLIIHVHIHRPYGFQNHMFKNLGLDFPGGQKSACLCRVHGFNPWARKIPHTTGQLGSCVTANEHTWPRAHAPQQEKSPQ